MDSNLNLVFPKRGYTTSYPVTRVSRGARENLVAPREIAARNSRSSSRYQENHAKPAFHVMLNMHAVVLTKTFLFLDLQTEYGSVPVLND